MKTEATMCNSDCDPGVRMSYSGIIVIRADKSGTLPPFALESMRIPKTVPVDVCVSPISTSVIGVPDFVKSVLMRFFRPNRYLNDVGTARLKWRGTYIEADIMIERVDISCTALNFEGLFPVVRLAGKGKRGQWRTRLVGVDWTPEFGASEIVSVVLTDIPNPDLRIRSIREQLYGRKT